jgi:hypothetical protein
MAIDPISSQLTKAALNKVATPDTLGPKTAEKAYGLDQSAFGNVLGNHMEASNTSNNKLLEMVDSMMGGGGSSGGQGIKAIPADQINVDLNRVTEVAQSQQGGGAGGVNIFDMFKEINGSQVNMDSLVEQMGSGKKFSTQEMLQWQVFAHQHTMTYEMVSKFGEMANRAVQGPFQMQV